MKHTEKTNPKHLELIPVKEPEKNEDGTPKEEPKKLDKIKYITADGLEFEYPPIPAHILKDDPTAYLSLDGTICTRNPLKTVFYEQQQYLPPRLKKALDQGNPSPRQSQRAEELRILYLQSQYESTSNEFKELQERLIKNHEGDKELKVNPATIISAAASILGILLVTNYEHLHNIGKGLNLVPKPQIK